MSRRVKIAIAIAVAVLVVVIWFFAYYSPAGDELSEKEEALEEAQAGEVALRAELESLRALEEEAPSQEAELRRLNAAVPLEPELDTFILEANRIAVESGIDWLSVSPNPPVIGAVGGASVVTMTIEVEGGFFQVLDYLNRLEELERLVVVDGVAVSAGGGEGEDAEGIAGTGAPRLSMSLDARMFTRSDVAFGATEGGADGAATGTETDGTGTGGDGTETTPPGDTGPTGEEEPEVTAPGGNDEPL